MTETIPPEAWPDRLQAIWEHVTAGEGHVHVVRETNSTQDAARRLNAKPGDVVVAWNQNAGRGQRGRAGTCGTEGVAMTIVDQPDQNPAWSLRGGVAAAQAIETLLLRRTQMKWPNDVLVDDLKIAGILVEQSDACTLIGIGLNVSQREWPDELTGTATSLLELGLEVDRVEVIECLMEKWEGRNSASGPDSEPISVRFFKDRDWLTGREVTLQYDRILYQGRLTRIDPLQDLTIETQNGELKLPAAGTSLLEVLPVPE